MMKKFLFLPMLALIILLPLCQNQKVEASDYYVGTFKDGYDAYLMTETLDRVTSEFKCTVKARKNSNMFYIYYRFWWNHEVWSYSNSQGFSGVVSRRTPVARNILKYVAPGALVD